VVQREEWQVEVSEKTGKGFMAVSADATLGQNPSQTSWGSVKGLTRNWTESGESFGGKAQEGQRKDANASRLARTTKDQFKSEGKS